MWAEFFQKSAFRFVPILWANSKRSGDTLDLILVFVAVETTLIVIIKAPVIFPEGKESPVSMGL